MNKVVGIVDVKNIVKSVHDKFGIDLRNYNLTLLRQRFLHLLCSQKYFDVSHLLDDIKNNKFTEEQFLDVFLIRETEFFRDASFWRDVRDIYIPELLKKENPTIWMPGVLSGEEVFTMAIILQKMGLQDKVNIIASCDSLNRMNSIKQGGLFDDKEIEISNSNYTSFSGESNFEDYCINGYSGVKMQNDLLKNVTFQISRISQEELDSSDSVYDMIIFRNILIQYTLPLYDKVVCKLIDRLSVGGYLMIGSKETLEHTDANNKMRLVSATEKIYQKKYN